MSNMADVRRTQRAPRGRPCDCETGAAQALVSVLPLTSPSTVLPVTCGAARGFGRLLAAFAHAVLEAAHRAAKVRADVAQLLGAEDQHHDHQDDQPMPDAERAHMRRPPISSSVEHRAQRLRPAEDVHMDMIHLLMPHPAGVDDGAEAVRRALLAGESPGEREHLAERLVLRHAGVVQRGDVLLRNDQEVHRRLRPDVVESEHVLVLVDLLRRDLAAHDLAENAVRIASFRAFPSAAFSSMPGDAFAPLQLGEHVRRPRPWRASTIMQWNHRSAVSRTRCSRSPPFAASTVSVASSPIFFSMASSPLREQLRDVGLRRVAALALLDGARRCARAFRPVLFHFL